MEILGKGIKKMREKYKKKKELHPQSKPSYFTLKENLIYSQNLLKAGSWIYSLSDEKVFWTNEIYNILECRPEELDNVLEAFYDYIHPDDTREVKEAVKRALQGKEYEIEYRIVTPKGRHKFLLEKIRVIKDSRGEIEKIAGIIKDITESKIIENNNYILGKHINYLRNMSGVGSWKYDYTKGQIYWSEEVYDIYEIGVEELGNKVCNLKKLIHPEDLIILEKKFNEGLEGRVIDLEHKIILKNGKEKYLLIKGEPIFDKLADVVGLVGVVWDVTQIRKSQQKLDEVEREKGRAQKQFRALVQNSSDIFAIIKPDGMIKYISPAVKEILGYRPEELTGKFIFNSYDKEGVKRAKEMLEKIVHIHKGTIKRDMKCRTKSGDRVYTELIMSNYLDEPFINGIVVNIRDISRRIETEQKLKHLSNHDSLTQLPNRLYFNKKLADSCKMAAKTSTGFTLIMLDIDGFKHVNNALGYKLGDHLIIQVVKRLRKYLGNKFMARYLGDQFAIIIDKLDNRTHIEKLAQDIIDLFTHSFNVGKYELYLTVSMGISIYPQDGENPDLLIKHAKDALFQARERGRNSYILYSAGTDIDSFRKFQLQNDLHLSIEREQLVLNFQPIVKMETGEIIAAEVLVRWVHPTWGIVGPDEFIPMAEETGFIIDLGKWILKETCRIYKKWLVESLPAIKIGINYSTLQLYEKDFARKIGNIIKKFQLDPSFLIMEITESILMQDSKRVNGDIKQLQDLGIQIALDDFGTGYSSLSYLGSFNIDILKIDRSFIENIPYNKTNTVIVEFLIKMAKDLNLKLVAEGIENWDQFLFLKNLNCHTGQGYIFGKPVSKEEFKRILAKNDCRPSRK